MSDTQLQLLTTALAGRYRVLRKIMGDYFRVGFMMNAVDRQLPADRKALLPPLNR